MSDGRSSLAEARYFPGLGGFSLVEREFPTKAQRGIRKAVWVRLSWRPSRLCGRKCFLISADSSGKPALLIGFRREAREKAVDTRRVPVSPRRRTCTVRRAR